MDALTVFAPEPLGVGDRGRIHRLVPLRIDESALGPFLRNRIGACRLLVAVHCLVPLRNFLHLRGLHDGLDSPGLLLYKCWRIDARHVELGEHLVDLVGQRLDMGSAMWAWLASP